MESNPNKNGPHSAASGRPAVSPPNGPGSSRYPRVVPVEDDDDASFRGAPDVDESSSILGALGNGPLSAVHSDTSSSRVELLAHLRPKTDPTASQTHAMAIQVVAPPTVPIDDESNHFDMLYAAPSESSAVDLGSRNELEVPLLLDSQASGGSAVLGTMPRRASSSVQLGGSAAGSFRSAASGMSAASPLPWIINWRENPQAIAWGGGTLIGVAISVVLFGGLAMAGIVHFGPGDIAETTLRYAAELRTASLRTNELQNRALDLQAEAAAARRQAVEARSQLDQVTHELQLARTDYDKVSGESKSLRDQIASTTAKLEQNQNENRAELERVLEETNDRLAKLTAEQAERLRAIEKATADQLRAEAAQTAAARKALNDFQRLVNQKLSDANLISGNAKPEELLAAVDSALARKPAATLVADKPNADRLLSCGLRAFRDRDYAQAECHLAAAAKANTNDARIRYLLGLARRHLGRADDAQTDFYVAAALERKYQPSPRDVDEILVRLSVSDRGIIGQYRP